MKRSVLVLLLLAGPFAHAQTPDWATQVAGLDARLVAVDVAGSAPEAALERLEAQQAVAALPKTRARERLDAYEVAEALVRRAEFAVKSAELEAQLLALDRERDGILLEASRRDAELARKEAERMRLLALAREEEEALAAAGAAAEDAAAQEAQARELADAEAKDAELARLEEELAAQAAAKGDVLASRSVGGKPAYRLSASAFQPGKAVLMPEAKQLLQQLARKLKAGGKTWSIEGHTDNLGGEDGNLELSLQRAEAVRAVFRAAGIPAGKLGVKGWGSAKPLAANTGKNGRAQNRRIEILPK